MDSLAFLLTGRPLSEAQVLAAAGALLALLLLGALIASARARRRRRREAELAAARQEALSRQLTDLARTSQELSGRVEGMAGQLNARQTDISRLMAERLDRVSANVGEQLQSSAEAAGATLAALKERIAVIDAAQARIAGMTQEVVSLKDILAN